MLFFEGREGAALINSMKKISLLNSMETVLKRKLVSHCIFVDDLTKLVEIGEYYDIIGLPKTDIQDDRITLAVEVGVVCKHD